MHHTESEIWKLHMILTPQTREDIDRFGKYLPLQIASPRSVETCPVAKPGSVGHVTRGFPTDKPVQTCG